MVYRSLSGDLEVVETVNWGIIGSGYAARQFAAGLKFVRGSRLIAVASRSADNAQRFAGEFGVSKVHADYSRLVADPAVDIVFIATPNSRHKADCMLALNADKPVVCEKPFALNAEQAKEIFALAGRRRLFCMEAMWTRFMPVISAARQMLADGAIGEPALLHAVLGHRIEFDAANRLYDLSSGGGVLLDLGIYTISLATFLLGGSAELVASDALIGDSGVDEQCAALLRFSGARTATIQASFRSSPSSELMISGTDGCLRIHAPLYRPEYLSLSRNPNQPRRRLGGLSAALVRLSGRMSGAAPDQRTYAYPVLGNGANYQAVAAADCLRNDELESSVMPSADTLRVLEIMDAMRAQWGLAYPDEEDQRP